MDIRFKSDSWNVTTPNESRVKIREILEESGITDKDKLELIPYKINDFISELISGVCNGPLDEIEKARDERIKKIQSLFGHIPMTPEWEQMVSLTIFGKNKTESSEKFNL